MKIKNYIGTFNDFVKEINDKYKELTTQHSLVDKKQQDLLHFIELESYSASTGAKVLKLLKQVRIERRVIKDELSIITELRTRIGSKEQEIKNEERFYSYRTNVLDMIKETK